MTASTRCSRNRVVGRARHGTWVVDLKNERRAQLGSSQYQRYLDHTTSTGPATGMSRIRWYRRSLTLTAITPQVGHSGGGRFQR